MTQGSGSPLLKGGNRTRIQKRYEGFELYRMPREDGKKGSRTIGVYTGYYYRLEGANSRRVLLKMLYAFLTLAAFALFIWCGTRPYPYNLLWHIGLTQYAALVVTVVLAVTLASYLTAGRQMTGYVYKTSSQRLIKVSFICSIAFGLNALFILIYYIGSDFSGFGQDWPGMVGLTGCALAMFAIAYLEKRTPYERFKSKDTPPEGAEKMTA